VNPRRLTLLVATGLVVTGCGASANALGTPTHVTSTHVASAHDTLTLAHPTAAPTTTPAPAVTPAPAPPKPQVVVVADQGNVSGASFEVALVSSTGAVLASTQVPKDAQWTIGTGPNAAYWVTGGKLQRLDEHGAVTTVATVPRTEAGRVVLSPDGSQWAYATTSQDAQSVITNRLYRGGIGQAARLIAERSADPNHPSADTPGLWQYYLLSWTTHGLLIERQPVGGCGCGTPFDMQMSAAYSAFIDPATGNATPLGTSASCPMSGIGADGTLACFHVSSTGASDSLQLINGSQTTHRYHLSGKTAGGDATFNGSTLAYATVPSTAGGCGAPDWRPQTTLHLMDAQTGDARSLGRAGLAPVAWLSDGSILATLSVVRTGSTTSSVVVVDPATGGLRTVFDRSFEVVGLA
jgi:hypothetical protein